MKTQPKKAKAGWTDAVKAYRMLVHFGTGQVECVGCKNEIHKSYENQHR
jgi:hypothetical protein